MKKLTDIPDTNPFKVPDNYFVEVNRKINSATSDSDKEVRKISIHNKYRTYLLIAAAFAGFILIGYTSLKLLTPVKINSQVSEVLYNVNPDSYINDVDISSLEEDASLLFLTEEGSGVNKTDIIDYLLLDNIEINDIMNIYKF